MDADEVGGWVVSVTGFVCQNTGFCFSITLLSFFFSPFLASLWVASSCLSWFTNRAPFLLDSIYYLKHQQCYEEKGTVLNSFVIDSIVFASPPAPSSLNHRAFCVWQSYCRYEACSSNPYQNDQESKVITDHFY